MWPHGLSWLLFYASVLDVTRTPELDVADPAGLVRSQVVESQNRGAKIALNGALSQRTLSGRFLHEFFGSGVKHIAFTRSDIEATARVLKAAGVSLLPIPANYYEDLGARFALEPRLVDRLQKADALYDRDEDGEYLQLYTLPVAERFFLRDRRATAKLPRLWASNAAIRLAAQTRTSGRDPRWGVEARI